MPDFLDIIEEGVKVNVAIDVKSAFMAALALFLALTLALVIYGKLVR